MQAALKEKLEAIVEKVSNMMADPDLEIEYCIPEVDSTTENCDVNAVPYIEVKYSVSQYNEPKRKIKLNDKYLEQDVEKIVNLITFSVEQFIEEIDAVQMG